MPGSEVEDFKIYGNLKGKIPGNHPLAKKHNELIDKLYNVTRAIELNTNPMTVDEESALRDYQSAMSEIVFGEDVHAKRNFGTPGVPDQMAATFHETLKDYGLDVDQSILEKEVNKETFGDMASEGMAGLTPIVLSFGAARGMKIQGPNKQVGFKNFSDFMHKAGDAMKNSVGGGKSKIWNSVVNLNVMGAEEVGVAIIGNQLNKTVFNQEGLPLADAYLFGYGNSIARGIQTKIAKSTLPYFSDFSRTKPGIVLGTVATPVVGGVTATATAKGVEAVNVGISWLNGEKQSSIDEQLHHLLDMNRNLAEVMNFTVLGLRGPMYQRAKARWQAVDAINSRTTKAANEFGIKQITLKQYEKLSPEEQGARVDEINRIADEKIKALMNKSNLVNQIETQNKIKEIDLNREILLNQNNILDTKIRIKRYDNSFVSAETKLDAIANKIISGEELALEDVSFLGEIGNEYINDKTNKSTGQVNVSNALNIISERFGFQKGTDQYKALETVLTNKSQIGQYIDFLAPDKADPFRKQTFDYLNETNNIRSKIAELESVPETSPSKPIAKAELEFQKNKLKDLDNNYAEKFGEFKTDQANKLDLDIEFVKKNAEKAGVKEVLSLNDAAFKKAAAENGFSSTADGIYFKDRIYINRDKALETGAISVGSHEFLHALLKNSFKSKDGLLTAEGKKILNEFYEGLTQQQKNIIDDRLDIYRYENTRTPEGRVIYKTNSKGERILNKDFENRRLEEILNLFVDGFRTGKFNLNEGVTAKLANVLKPVLNRLGKATSYDMSTVEGVRKFINDYAKSSKKGKIKDNLINELKKEEGVVDTDQLVFASESFGKEFDRKADIDVTKKEWDAGGYDKAFKMVDEGILDGQIIQDVGKKKIPIRGEKIVIEGKEFTKREFIEDVRSEIKNVIRNFNPEVNESLLGWINNPKNFPNKRKVVFEAYEKIALGEKAARGEGRAEIELVPQRPVEPAGAGRTESMKLLSASGRADLIENVKNQITDGGKYPLAPETMDAYLNTFKNKLKDIPNLAAKELAKEIGIPENKITDPADNLSGPEAFKAQRWLMSNMNYAKAIDLMPFNNVPVFKEYAYKPGTVEKIRHPKSRKGENFIYLSIADAAMLNKPTGLFGNIKRDFFTKTDQRIGNDFLWTKNEFSEKYFLEKVGIKDRKKAETFTQRASEAQTLKGVLNYIAKDMTLKAMSEEAGRLGLQNEVNNLRSGKNVYAASESYVSKLPEFVQHDFVSNRLSDIAREFKIEYDGLPKEVKEVKAIVDKLLKGKSIEDFTYNNNDTKAIAKALFNSLKVSELEIQRNKDIAGRIEATDVENTIKNYFEEFLLANNETITENVLGIGNGVLAAENRLFERQEEQRNLDSGWWSHSMEKATDKFQAAVDLASIGREQFTNSSTIGDKRYMYHGGTAKWNSRLNEVLFDYGFKLENNKVVDIKTGESREASGIGSAFHNSEKALKLMEEAIKDGLLDYNSPKVKEVYEQYDQVSQKARKLIADQMEYIVTQFKEGRIDNIALGLRTMNLKSGMGSVLRLAAPLRGIYIPLPGEKLLTKNSIVIGKTKEGKPIREKLLVWEHNKSAEQFLLETLKIYMNESNTRQTSDKNKTITLNKKGKEALEKVYEDFYVNIIPHTMDVMVKDRGYQVYDPLYGTRYYNSKTYQDPRNRAYYDIKNDVVVGGAWANAAENALNPVLAKENLKSNEVSFASESDVKNNFEYLESAKNQDQALSLAKKVNKPVKKIRVFDFDDTMARTKSLVFYNRPSKTSNVKPKLKAIVMAGTPGGGKSSVVKGLGLVKDGFKEVNQDISLEWLKTKEGLPAKEADYTKEQKSIRSKLGAQARKIAVRKLDKFSKQGDGIILDGTGASLKATESKVKALEDLGYEVSMIYVDTPKETAIARNKARAERSLPDFIVSKTWDAVNANKEVYAGRFGNRFYDINTEGLRQGEVPREISEAIKTDLAATERGRLTAEEFAKEGKNLVEEGFEMDFSDFNIVREGERGPLFEVAEKIRDTRGTDDVFILTARAPESAPAIREFLKSEGLDIPLKNITGLGNSTGEAKAQWIVSKAAEGYNDFYFADDALANVKAVKEALAPLDVKSKVQQAYASESEVKSIEFNKLLEQSTGIEYYKEYSAAKAKTIGASKGKFKFWIPYSAEDFQGLIYPTLAKGKLGDKQMAWYKTNLLNPYARAMDNLSRDRVQLMSDFKALKKQLDVPKDLRKKNNTGFTILALLMSKL
jgi:predicted kinase